MKQTSKYQLNLMESGDAFSPDPINENTQALENALVTHNADENAHSALRTAVSEHAADRDNPHAVTAAQVGAAAASHNHSAAAITSGTLPVSRGGTGNTSVDSTPVSGSKKMVTSGGVYTALEGKAASSHTHSEYAAASHNHAAGNITSGTLPVSRGGTGNSSVDSTPVSGSKKMVTSGGVYTALTKKYGTDNAPWVIGSYTGNGSDSGQSVNLGFKPSAVFIVCTANGIWGIMLQNGTTHAATSTYHKNSDVYGFIHVSHGIAPTESGFTVKDSNNSNDKFTVNETDYTYLYLALR